MVHLHISILSMAFLNPVKNDVTLLSSVSKPSARLVIQQSSEKRQ